MPCSSSIAGRAVPLGLACALAAGCLPYVRSQVGRPRVLFVVCDGLGADLLTRMHDQGATPALDAIARHGARAAYASAGFPMQRAAAAAAIWSGCGGDCNGVTGNRIPALPRSKHSVLASVSGQEATHLQAEPIWVDAARHGLSAWVMPAPQSAPPAAYGPWGRGVPQSKLAVSALPATTPDRVIDERTPLARATGWRFSAADRAAIGAVDLASTRELAFQVEGTPLWGLFFHDPARAGNGLNALLVRMAKAQPGGWLVFPDPAAGTPAPSGTGTASFVPVPISGPRSAGQVAMRLFSLAPDGSRYLLYLTAVGHPTGNGPAAAHLLADLGPVVMGGAAGLYRSGRLGPTLLEGGDGTAERRYAETVAWSLWTLSGAIRRAEAEPDWDLLVGYLPFPGEVERLWAGLIDPGNVTYQPRAARVVSPLLERVVGGVDALLGKLQAGLPAGMTLAIAGDQAVEGAGAVFYPDEALRTAGLLIEHPDGTVDLARSRVVYPPENAGYVLVNTTEYRGGIVPPVERGFLVDQAAAALEAAHDAAGHPLVARLLDPERADRALGMGGPEGGDLYLEPVPGVQLSADSRRHVLLVASRPLAATRPGSHTVFYLSGAGARQGVAGAPIALVDEAPTLCRLLRIPAPARATGKAATDMLNE